RDRRLVIEQAPGYGVVGGPVSLSFHIEDPGQDGVAELSIRRDGGAPSTVVVPLNRSTRMDFPLEHAGVNSLELTAAAVPGELTLANNHAAVVVHGIRDRLRVLLVSGEPHAGERIWRNLLKADPSVDLVHFTILRPPEKNDRTPLKDLALIAFPVRELFEEKLKEFDLIIFDRFRIRNILPESYYRNISEYVKSGGALLVSVGPEFAGPESLSNSALASILPAVPDGQILAQAFLPQLSPVGRRHPVTSGLPGAETDPPQWGRWVRQIGGQVKAGAVLMETPAGKPLLLLDRPGDGRVALLLSDSSWLWTRGWEGGGPQAELLRRTAHWLMHEPDLEEEQLSAEVVGQRLKVVRRSLQAGNAEVKMAAPDGTTRALALTDQSDGRSIGETILDQVGLWRITDGRGVALAVLGSLNPLEMSDLRATADKLQPVVTETGGGLRWLVDGLPALRRTEPDGPQSGAGWIGLRANHQTVITTVRDLPLLPGWLLLLAGLGSLVLAWWREGR
ncbi:MAG TPA: hypothetical protein HPP80_03745, partial [Rhodospirillaceae bacterium]|nr:hypothetical protein [Rhodospirillaceae bacterium]